MHRSLRHIAMLVVVVVLASSCALFANGRNNWGQLGNGTGADSTTPILIDPGSAVWTDIAAGSNHACRIRGDRTLWCWGRNGGGQVGDGTTTNRTTPIQVGTDTDWVEVDAGTEITCAVKTTGTMWCWGRMYFGPVGPHGGPDVRSVLTPTQVGTATDWVRVTTGAIHACGRRTNGTSWCWGYNAYGQLGDGTTTGTVTPVQESTGAAWRDVDTGPFHTCGVRDDATLWCWGSNDFGELGDGTTTGQLDPIQIGTDDDWQAVEVDDYHSCGIRTATTVRHTRVGTLWCWGANWDGQVGDGTTTNRSTPTQIGSSASWLRVAAGTSHNCAIHYDGSYSLWCWGKNNFGQIGDGTTTDKLSPVQINDGVRPLLVAAGGSFTAHLAL